MQAKLAAELIQRGFSALATNQYTLQEIENTLALLAQLVNREREGEKLLDKFHESDLHRQRMFYNVHAFILRNGTSR